MLPGRREGWPGLGALARGLRLAEAQPGAPQGPGAGDSPGAPLLGYCQVSGPGTGRCFQRECCRIPWGMVPLWRRAVPPGVLRTARVQQRLGALGPSAVAPVHKSKLSPTVWKLGLVLSVL